MTATVEFDNFTVFTYEILLIHASPPPVKYSLRLRRYYILTPWPECKGPWNRMTACSFNSWVPYLPTVFDVSRLIWRWVRCISWKIKQGPAQRYVCEPTTSNTLFPFIGHIRPTVYRTYDSLIERTFSFTKTSWIFKRRLRFFNDIFIHVMFYYMLMQAMQYNSYQLVSSACK